MNEWHKVAIIGVGLIGGSVGLALRSRGLAQQVVGLVRRKESLQEATAAGAVSRATLDFEDAVAGADLVVVCSPVDCIAEHVRKVSALCGPRTLITDAGSTKASIAMELDGHLPGGRFVGSHPLAGSEKTGPRHAAADLFAGKTVVVTPTASTARDDVAAIRRFWELLGAIVVEMPPDDHDRAVAATSHLPRLVAAALAAATPEADLPLAASGWRDTTRIAAGDPVLWKQIALDNGRNILAALARFESHLAALRQALETRNAAELESLLAQGKARRDAAPQSQIPNPK